ncbi:MAG: hypothetical protein RL264_1326 [Bacteroidota bacterium]|jgi:hypothetical protein
MQDLSIYFTPISITTENFVEGTIGDTIIKNETEFPEVEKNSIALIYVPEARGSKNIDYKDIDWRNKFYEYKAGWTWASKIYDLGDVLPGNNLEDTYFALSNIVEVLVKNRILPIIIGGSQDLIFPIYKGYVKLEQMINLCSIDYKFDIGQPDIPLDAENYLSQLLVHRPCYLFNHANIGAQSPFISSVEMQLYNNLMFDSCRLGEFNEDFKKAEPHLRNADLVSVDFRSVKMQELASSIGNPNGFYAEQICQLFKYSGISDKVTALFVSNIPSTEASMRLLAEGIWYFIDGFHARKGDFPIGSKKDYKRFHVLIDDGKYEIVFFKSNKSDRWWMEVPYPSDGNTKYERHTIVPCNKDDYEQALSNVIPDLWWKTYQKLG